MELETVLAEATQLGFSHVGKMKLPGLEFLPEVRDMCAADRCHNYGKSWSCPPGCGSLETISALAVQYRRGVLVQSTGLMEDDFDVETMMEAQQQQKERFAALVDWVREALPHCLPMASGGCTICPKCTYPDAPCRFPQRAIPSMEAYGLVVSKVCEQSGLPYYYGPKTITYTSCILLD